jgi:phosphatidylinositol-3-phosphatase
MALRGWLLACMLTVCALSGGCGSGQSEVPASPAPFPSPIPAAQASPKIFLVVLENHGYDQVVGNPRLPFLNSLLAKAAMADGYYANTHPSIGNYFMLTTGQAVTDDDNFSGTVSDDNLARELNAEGKSWRVYAQSLPDPGFLGFSSGDYVRRHDPFAYFSEVVNDASQAAKIVPFTQFAADLSAKSTADFNYLLPDRAHDMHECGATDAGCTLEQREIDADQWLQANLSPLLSDAEFQQRGLLIITFDEALNSDVTNGGGHVLTLFAGPRAKAGYHSANVYQHPSLLNLMCHELQCPALPGAAVSAPAMTEFVQ